MGTIRSNVDIDALLLKLTLEEKVSLLSATDWWRTPAIQRDGFVVPHLKVRGRSPPLPKFFKNID